MYSLKRGAADTRSKAESCIHVLCGLISYHKRMIMGKYPERDFYLEALEYALKCVEEKLWKNDTAQDS